MSVPFFFYTRFNLVRLLGLKARNPRELLGAIKVVPISSIYYHTHKFLQQHHYLSPEPPNDFAYWINNILNIKVLAEAFASVNIIEYEDMEDVRSMFARILADYLSRRKNVQECQEGMDFHFMSCTTFIMQTKHVADNVKEFIEILEKISVNSLYFHMFEAKLRLRRDENDFSSWLDAVGHPEAAKKLSSLDPYTITLDGLRKKIIEVVKTYAPYQ